MEVIFEEVTDWYPKHSRGRSEPKDQIENAKVNNDLGDREGRALTFAADNGRLVYHSWTARRLSYKGFAALQEEQRSTLVSHFVRNRVTNTRVGRIDKAYRYLKFDNAVR